LEGRAAPQKTLGLYY